MNKQKSPYISNVTVSFPQTSDRSVYPRLSTVTCSGITWNLEISNTLLPSVVLFSVWELSVSHTPPRLYTFLANSFIEIPSGVDF